MTDAAASGIDRRALVTRHNIVRSTVDYRVPVQLGNGRFAFNADITGLQSFVAFASLSEWAWHSEPVPTGVDLAAFRGRGWRFRDREIVLPDLDPDQPAATAWLRNNPHRLNLGRIGLLICDGDGLPVTVAALSDCRQELDLWSGLLRSHVEVDGVPVDVTTCCHPDLDAVAASIASPLLAAGRLSVFIDFPGGDSRYFAPQVGDWANPRAHRTSVFARGERRLDLCREVDDTTYHVGIGWDGEAAVALPVPVERPRRLRVRHASYGDHDVTQALRAALGADTLAVTVNAGLLGRGRDAPEEVAELRLDYQLGTEEHSIAVPYGGLCRIGDDVCRHRHVLHGHGERLEVVTMFSPTPCGRLPDVAAVIEAAGACWPAFWRSGGAIELAASRDGRALELERRIVLSQYVMAVNEAGTLPPQETGLVNNSWSGKFHFEMYVWHAAHWALWQRWPILRRSLGIYRDLLPSARERAAQQGFAGARWPKCTGPDGRETPGEIHSLLVWQQPHVCLLAELDYAAHPTARTLRWWAPIVHETAEFLASYVALDEQGRYVLGPPVHVVSENTDPARTANPAFELAYWRFGLRVAQAWRERLGQPRNPHWDDVQGRLSPLPVDGGEYAMYEGIEGMWQRYAFEHPALTGMYGWLPGDGVDPATMRRTAERIFAEWDLDRVWGWDFPMLAMCAARLGQPDRAVEFLLHDGERFHFGDSGLPTGGPFPYLPSSGALLYAVAMMAAGWPGAQDRTAPGFPDPAAGWVVRYEGLQQAL